MFEICASDSLLAFSDLSLLPFQQSSPLCHPVSSGTDFFGWWQCAILATRKTRIWPCFWSVRVPKIETLAETVICTFRSFIRASDKYILRASPVLARRLVLEMWLWTGHSSFICLTNVSWTHSMYEALCKELCSSWFLTSKDHSLARKKINPYWQYQYTWSHHLAGSPFTTPVSNKAFHPGELRSGEEMQPL